MLARQMITKSNIIRHNAKMIASLMRILKISMPVVTTRIIIVRLNMALIVLKVNSM